VGVAQETLNGNVSALLMTLEATPLIVLVTLNEPGLAVSVLVKAALAVVFEATLMPVTRVGVAPQV
jgi:hypothetical protein